MKKRSFVNSSCEVGPRSSVLEINDSSRERWIPLSLSEEIEGETASMCVCTPSCKWLSALPNSLVGGIGKGNEQFFVSFELPLTPQRRAGIRKIPIFFPTEPASSRQINRATDCRGGRSTGRRFVTHTTRAGAAAAAVFSSLCSFPSTVSVFFSRSRPPPSSSSSFSLETHPRRPQYAVKAAPRASSHSS